MSLLSTPILHNHAWYIRVYCRAIIAINHSDSLGKRFSIDGRLGSQINAKWCLYRRITSRPYLLCQRALSIEGHRYHAPIAAVYSLSTPRHNNVFVGSSESSASFNINRNHQREIFSVALQPSLTVPIALYSNQHTSPPSMPRMIPSAAEAAPCGPKICCCPEAHGCCDATNLAHNTIVMHQKRQRCAHSTSAPKIVPHAPKWYKQ